MVDERAIEDEILPSGARAIRAALADYERAVADGDWLSALVIGEGLGVDDAVKGILARRAVADVGYVGIARRFGISRQAAHKLWRLYVEDRR